MPKKSNKKGKGEPDLDNITLGRFGKTLKIGLVGLPNVGKSTTFNFLSDLNVPAENYSFCTKEPHEARVAVPDERYEKLCEIWKPKSKVPAYLNIWDIAGLIRGAHEGAGLGNAFLSNIQSVDGIFHVVRAFDDVSISHYEGEVNPIRDMETIQEELVQKDIAAVETRIAELNKLLSRSNDKQNKEELEIMEKVKIILGEKKWVKDCKWNSKEVFWLNKHLFMTAKPVIYLANISKTDFEKQKNRWLPKIKAWIKENCPGKMIPYSAAYEKAVAAGEVENPKSMVSKIIHSGYKNLKLFHFFTAGKDEVKCWTVKKGAKAPQAAGKIHSDMQDGFICADVVNYNDFVELKTEAACKSAGKLRQQGKDYVVQDGDICHFKFNPPKGKKKK